MFHACNLHKIICRTNVSLNNRTHLRVLLNSSILILPSTQAINCRHSLPTADTPCTLHCTLYNFCTLHYTLYNFCTLYSYCTLHCTLYSYCTLHCTLYSYCTLHCTLYSYCTLHCTLYSYCTLHCTLYSYCTLYCTFFLQVFHFIQGQSEASATLILSSGAADPRPCPTSGSLKPPQNVRCTNRPGTLQPTGWPCAELSHFNWFRSPRWPMPTHGPSWVSEFDHTITFREKDYTVIPNRANEMYIEKVHLTTWLHFEKGSHCHP